MGKNDEKKVESPNEVVDEEAAGGVENTESADSVSVVLEPVSEIICTKKEVALYGCGVVTVSSVLTFLIYYLAQYYHKGTN